jgi:hypothetical protein
MLNTVEKRRQALVVVACLVLLHLFASGTLIPLESVQNTEIQDSLQGLYAEYDLLLSGK